MIQRIQTVFLLVATILLIFLLFFPISEFLRTTDQTIFEFGFKGLTNESGDHAITFFSVPFSLLVAICLLLTLVTIFLYKKRMLQIRLSTFNIVILVGLQGLMFYYIKAAQTALPGEVSYTIFFVFPFVAAILVFLALRAIARDEALVRSLDRLR